jgi:hypothetical protein
MGGRDGRLGGGFPRTGTGAAPSGAEPGPESDGPTWVDLAVKVLCRSLCQSPKKTGRAITVAAVRRQQP